MNNLLQIKNLLPELNSTELEDLEKLIKEQSSQNRKDLNTAISTGNTEDIDFFIKKVSFDDIYFKHIKNYVVPHIKSLHYLKKIDLGTIKFVPVDEESHKIFYILFNEIFDLGETFQHFQKRQRDEKFILPVSDILFSNLFCRLKVNFQYSGNEPYPVYLFFKSVLKNHPVIFKEIIDQFTKYGLSKVDYQENSLLISDLIKSGYQDILFQQAKNENNYQYLQNTISRNEIYSDQLMLTGLVSYHFPIVKNSFENGIPFFKSGDLLSSDEKAAYKNAFSSVFASKESLLIQEYIIDNIPDISVGNHIIVKTILNKLESKTEFDIERNEKRMELIHKIMNKYLDLDDEKILSFKSVLEKREESLAKNYLTKFINFHTLNTKLTFNSNESSKKNKI